jgi:hypothetical protein
MHKEAVWAVAVVAPVVAAAGVVARAQAGSVSARHADIKRRISRGSPVLRSSVRNAGR